MMIRPFFSVITVCKDNLSGLRRTHQSVAEQICRDFEWIVIDGASDDGTKEYLAVSDAQWLSEPDEGLYGAMNKGIERATGEYLIFMNAGDRFAGPDILKKIMEACGENRPDFIYGDSYEQIGWKIFYKKARSHKKIIWGMFTHHQAMIYKKSFIGDMRFDCRYRIAADYDFTWRFLKRARNITYIPQIFCLFEAGGISHRNILLGRQEQFVLRERNNVLCFQNHLITAMQATLMQSRLIFPIGYRALRKLRLVKSIGG